MTISEGKETANLCVVPGQLLYSIEDGYIAGNGSYEIHGRVHSGLAGIVKLTPKKGSDGKEINIVEVCGRHDEKKYVLPQNGVIVTARVESLCLRYAKCSILCVANTYLMDEFSATLRKEDVRDLDKDKVELWKAVQPGDIILARVVGVGDKQTEFLISISEPELGVVHAVGLNGERMVPDTLTSVKQKNLEYREQRKCAKVPDLNS